MKNIRKIFTIRTLRLKLIILFLLIGLVPLGLTSAILYSLSSEALIEEGEVGLEEISISTANTIDQWFDKRVGEIELASRTDNMKSLDAEQQQSLVNTVKNQSNSYETVVFTGTDGTVRAHTTEDNIGTLHLADRDYFQKAMSGETFISDVLTSRATGNRIVVVATPVQGDNGETLGVMSASVNFEQLVSQFLEEDHSQNLIPVLIDNQKVIQVHPVPEWVGIEMNESGLSPEAKALMENGLDQTGHSLFEDQGQQFIMAYSPIERTGYQLFMYTPLENVLSGTDALKKSTLLMLGICFIVIVAIAWFFGKSISKPIHHITKHVERIAEGDLTADTLVVTTKDEIGTLTEGINKMSVNLKALIHDVNNNAESVASHAEELTASAEESKTTTEYMTSSIQQIASGAETQSEQVSESVRALEEMTAGIQQIAESSTAIAETSSETIDKAEVGGMSVKKTVEQMRSIQSSVDASNESIFLLDERSREIGKIVEIITGIANQTNLLALNAAIEAARAGEQGKGFAVVADEVRKLAEESKNSSDQIGRLVSEIQKDMARSLEGMMKVTKDVSDGLELADTTQTNFTEIIETTKSVTEQIDSMAATAEQLSAGAQQVTATFSVISEISRTASAHTQEVASSSEEQLGSIDEIASSAESLSTMALELREMVKRFQV